MKNKVVVFQNNQARIYTTLDPTEYDYLKGEAVVLVNPDTGLVDHLPPELWALSDSGQIVPQENMEEAVRRLRVLKSEEVVQNAELQKAREFRRVLAVPEQLADVYENISFDIKELKHDVLMLRQEADKNYGELVKSMGQLETLVSYRYRTLIQHMVENQNLDREIDKARFVWLLLLISLSFLILALHVYQRLTV